MTARSPELGEALDLVAVLESRCGQLRQIDERHVEAIVGELEQLLLEIRDMLRQN